MITRRISSRGAVLVCAAIVGLLVCASLSLAPASNAGQFWVEGEGQAPPRMPSLSGLAQQVSSTVVNISTTKVVSRKELYQRFYGSRDDGQLEEFFRKFFDERTEVETRQTSLGSGFIISGEGYILTNNHVIAETEEIIVSLSDDEEYPAEVVGKDDKTDIALIKIDPGRKVLPVAVLGDSEELVTGDWVIAIGNLFGLGHMLTQGIVSAKGRIIGAGPYDNFIQTDAAINPGNSGGPLMDLRGRVVGINTAIVAAGQGIGFAVPINMAKEILIELKSAGEVRRGWIGVAIQAVSARIARAVNLDEARGAMVTVVYPGDPAERAGVQTGDIILEVNGQAITDPHSLTRLVGSIKPGKDVTLVVWRDGARKRLHSTLMRREDRHVATLGREQAPPQEFRDRLGLTVTEVTPEIARRLELEYVGGILVLQVDPAGSAADSIARGDIILEVDRQAVGDMPGYMARMDKARKGRPLLLLIRRNAGPLFVAVEVE